MLKLFNRKTERDKEEEKKEEENKEPGAPPKVKKSPGELRLKKEVAELDLPSHS